MKLKLAIAISSANSGCQVRFIDSASQIEAHYSQPMLAYEITAQPGDLLAIDTDYAPLRIVFRWPVAEVIAVEDEGCSVADAAGNVHSLHLAEKIQDAPTVGEMVFTAGQRVIDFAQNGLPQNPARIGADFFPMIKAMYQPMDSPYLSLVDTHTGGPRNDVTPLFADYDAFATLVRDLAAYFEDVEFDCVAGIDALGFILGTALAWHFAVGFLAVRKGGKLPVETDSVEFVDYTGQQKSLELRKDALQAGTKVLLVDEWIETGAQARAAIALIEGQGGFVAGIAAICIDDNPQTRTLKEKYNVQAVWGVVD